MEGGIRRIASIIVILAAGVVPANSTATPASSGGPDGGPDLGPPPPTAPEGLRFGWDATPSGIAGYGVVVDDEYVLTDAPFDDTGADLDGSDGRTDNPLELYPMLEGALAATGQAGDFTYPADPSLAANGADIVEVRAGVAEDTWFLLVILNTLVDPDRVALEVNLAGPADHTLLVHGLVGTLDGEPVDVEMDAEQNAIEVAIPVDTVPLASYEVSLGAGVWDPTADDWLRPDSQAPPFFDLAYEHATAETTYWNDGAQSRLLAEGRYGSATFDLFLWALAGCTEACPSPHKPVPDNCLEVAEPVGGAQGCIRAPRVRVFRSGQDLGEGIELETRHDQHEQGLGYRFYRSAYQPYAVYEPSPQVEGPRPLVLLLHFLGGNYMSYPITSFTRDAQRWADALGATVVMPHARGEAGWYEGPAEKDVFEVWRDVAQHYDIDAERVYLAGMSMGGFGTWRLGSLYPDQFAAGIVWAGPVTPNSIWPAPAPVMWPRQNPPMCERSDPACGYTLTDVFSNLGTVPMHVVHGGLDELVPSTGPQGWMSRYDDVGGTYRFISYPTRRHETSFPATTADRIIEWLGDLPARDRAPATVDYTLVRDLFQPEHGLTYDGAYWVEGLRLASGRGAGAIHASSLGGGSTVAVGPRVGADDLGPYVLKGRNVHRTGFASPDIYVDASGLEAATLDTATIPWTDDPEHAVHVETDEALILTFAGGLPPTTEIEVHAGTIEHDWLGGDLVVSIAAGPAYFVLHTG